MTPSPMIEVEKKFILSDSDVDRLTEGVPLLSERSFTDVYYDDAIFSLTIKDRWLRRRDGKWELKMPLHDGADRLADQYDEITDVAKIWAALGVPDGKGYTPFVSIITSRRKYKTGSFVLDLDAVDFGTFVYHIFEIELLVNEKSEIEGAIQKILAFAKEKNLTIAPVRGKVVEYLKRERPEHYQALLAAKVVKDF